MQFNIRNFEPEDVPQIIAVQQAYHDKYTDFVIRPPEVYLSPGFEGGNNIFCAFDQNKYLQGYTALFPQTMTEQEELALTIWAGIINRPESESPELLKDILFERILSRTKEIAKNYPGRKCRLKFELFPSESDIIDFLISIGCSHKNSAFTMIRDLAYEVLRVNRPDGLTIHYWRMETEAEQNEYLRAQNIANLRAPLDPIQWRYFLNSPAWLNGTTVTAFQDNRVIGSVTVYWDKAENEQFRQNIGIMDNVFTDKDWRNRGIASYLLGEGLLYLKDRGMELARIGVRADNEKALGLYQRMGYGIVKECRWYVLEL